VSNDNYNPFSGDSHFSRLFWALLPRVFGFGLREGEALSEPALPRFNLPHGANPTKFLD
jgi:hypothetical protein